MRICLAIGLMLAAAACDMSNSPDPPKTAATAPQFDGADYKTEAVKIAHGGRLTRVLGCTGCHGDGLTGLLWDDDPKEYGVMWASNLTRSVPLMSDAQLKALLQAGVHPTRSEMWVMPSELFQHLSDPDLAALIAYLRTLAPAGTASPPPEPGPKAKAEIASGKIKPAAALVPELRDVRPLDLGLSHARARYVASVTCAECHGPTLQGLEGDTPDLIAAGSYSRDEFERLITKGIATGDRKLNPLMVSVSKNRFSHLTARERDELYAYLKARAERPQ